MKDELTELFRDLREQLSYLQELGVTSLNADLPEGAVQNPESELRGPAPELVIPEIPIFQKTPPSIENPKPELRVLKSKTLSGLPKLSDFSASKEFQNLPRSVSEVAPTKPNDPAPAETLFGDISQILPESNETLEEIRADIGNCRRCGLCENRTNIAHSTGNLHADLMFIGEAPGADEDAQGKPFVGRAGQLLTKIIESIGRKREDVFIGNINRCRPPQNRQPLPTEVIQCKPFLLREIAVVRPKVIVVLGNTACQNLLDTKVGITKLRGNFQDYFGIKVMPTFHPAFLLRDPSKKRETWEDMKKVRDYLNSVA